MTVITIVLIAIVLAVGTVIVNNVMNSSKKSSNCAQAGGVWYTGKCYSADKCTTTSAGKTSCSGSVMTCTDNSCS